MLQKVPLMWTRAETILAVGLATIALGGGLSPFVLIGLLGCLFLLIGLILLATGAVAVRNRAASARRTYLGIILLWTAALGLIIVTFGICELSVGLPGQALRLLPAGFGLPDWLVYLAADLLFAGLFAGGLRLAANFDAARSAGWAFAVFAVGPGAAICSYLLSLVPFFDLTA